jgi:hypothetical protein
MIQTGFTLSEGEDKVFVDFMIPDLLAALAATAAQRRSSWWLGTAEIPTIQELWDWYGPYI